jgi:hypothetical protein
MYSNKIKEKDNEILELRDKMRQLKDSFEGLNKEKAGI